MLHRGRTRVSQMQEGNKRSWLAVILPTKCGRAIVKVPGCMEQVMQHGPSNATSARLSCGQLVCLPNDDSSGG